MKKVTECPRCSETTCFANKHGGCTILTEAMTNCVFYKTMAQHEHDQKEARRKWLRG